jgi:tartrate dehydratase beta subunit/fumarate hydratase class I family protein
MNEVLSELTKYPIKTRLSLSGTLVVARDIAHAKLKERVDRGEGLPEYVKNHPIYYAGPAKTPKVLCPSYSCLHDSIVKNGHLGGSWLSFWMLFYATGFRMDRARQR